MELQFGSWRVAVEQVRPDPSELANSYNEIATSWQDSIARLGYPRAYQRLFETLDHGGSLSHLKAGSKVLDAGIGTGAVSEALLNVVKAPLHVHGLDISKEMVQEADRRLALLTPHRSMVVEDLLETSFEANTFDLVTAAHMLEHLEDPQGGLDKLVRLLKPGRPLVLIISRKTLFSSWLNLKWAITRTTPADLTDCFATAGLKDVQLIPLRGRPWIRSMSLACLGVKR